MISKKLQLMKAITAHLQGITPAWVDLPDEMMGVECPYDLSQKVFRGRTIFGDEVKEPFLAILEAPRQLDPLGGGTDRHMQDEDWTLLIHGFAEDDKKNPTDPAYDLLAWVQMRMARITYDAPHGQRGGLYPNEFRLGGKVTNVRYQIPIVRPGKDDVSSTAYFYMPISVGNVTDLRMPFAQED
jgi:hypothetical protein